MDEDFYIFKTENGCCHVGDLVKTYNDCGQDFLTAYDTVCLSYYCPTPSDCEGMSWWGEILLITFACILGVVIIIWIISCVLCKCMMKRQNHNMNKDARTVDREEQLALHN